MTNTYVELDKDGRKARVFHRSPRYAWAHDFDKKKDCEICVEETVRQHPKRKNRATGD